MILSYASRALGRPLAQGAGRALGWALSQSAQSAGPLARMAWKSTAWGVAHARTPVAQAFKDTWTLARALPRTAQGTFRALTRPDPAGRHIGNLFTGREINNPALLAAEVGAIGYAISAGQELALQTGVQGHPSILPALTRAGNPLVEAAQHMPRDPLLGARGGLAFALHRLRHG